MIIEEHEDGAWRGLLGTAFEAAEPPLRDLASGSIARGDAARRRNRWYAAGGTALSVVAVAGTLAAVAGVGRTAGPPAPAASTPTPSKTTATPDSVLANGRPVDQSVKFEDIRLRLPGLLQPLLPSGVSIQPAPSDYNQMDRNGFLLSGSTGTTLLSATGGKVEWSPGEDRTIGCLQQGSCDVRQLAGGTVYVNNHTYTAAQQAGSLKGSLKPGTEKTIAGQSVWMTFVPADRSKQYLQIHQSTAIAPLPYKDKGPADWMGPWPPSPWGGLKMASDPKGVEISADEFAALAGRAGIDRIETLLDPESAPSSAAVQALDGRNAQIAAVLAPVLPAGVRPSLTLDMTTSLILTGPSGQNELQFSTLPRDQSPFVQPQDCPREIGHCDRRTVTGGRMVTWSQLPTDSSLRPTSDKPNTYDYWFLPDDAGQPAVHLSLTTTYRTQTNAGPLVTADQFAAAAAKGNLVNVVTQLQSLLKP